MEQNQQIVDKAMMLLSKLDNIIDSKKNQSNNDIHVPADPIEIECAENNVEASIIDDIAIIYAFYGTDRRRILATTRAICQQLDNYVQPKDIVFIEAQQNKKNATFEWLKEYGINYFFMKIPSQSIGIFLKTALWNYGATKTSANKLCFIDSDVVFSNKEWICNAAKAFDEYDVLSLSKYCSYENYPIQCKNQQSIGSKLMEAKPYEKVIGHIGFNIGMTRAAYDLYGHFEAFVLHDDMWIWQKICGNATIEDIKGFTPYKTGSNKFGLPLKVGAIEGECVHLDHGYKQHRNYKAFGALTYDNFDIWQDVVEYDAYTPEKLPIWKCTNEVDALRHCVNRLEKCDVFLDNDFSKVSLMFQEELANAYGKIDDEHPLVITTIYRPDYIIKNTSQIIDFLSAIEKYCKTPFTFICFSNEKIDDGIDTIPFDVKQLDPMKIVFSRNVEYPKNAVVKYIDIHEAPTSDFIFHR